MPDAPSTASSSIGEAYLQQGANGGSATAVPQPDASAPAPPVVANPQNAQPAAAPPQPAPAPSPEQQAAVAQNAKHNAIGRFFSTLVGGGSGSSASQMWRSVVGGALVAGIAGAGAAENAPVIHGPYGDVRDSSIVGAAARGLQAGRDIAQQQIDRQQKQAQIDKQDKQREFENQIQMDDQTLRKAADARAQQESIRSSVEHSKRMTILDQSIAAGNFESTQRAAQVAQQQVSFFNALQDVGAQPLQGSDGEPLQFGNLAEAEKAAHDNPKFFIGDFKTRTAYNPTANKYEIYRVPETDIKNVQLKDPVTGQMHTIPRMTASEYLDYTTKVQNLQKSKLEMTKIGAEITRLQTDTRASGLYGNALKELNGAADKDGNVDLNKISSGSRAVLYDHAAKGLEDGSRAMLAAINKRSAATQNGDQAAIDEANEEISALHPIIKNYSGTLSALHGNPAPNPNQVSPNVKTAVDAISHLPKEQQAEQIDASKLTPAEKQAAKKALGLK
jgi:hypothetical protein